MSNATALRAAATGSDVSTKDGKPKTLADLLSDQKIKQQMQLALPKHITADRLARVAITEMRKVPKLATCDPTSFLGAVMTCAQLGLEPGGVLGHAYLIPFENRRLQKTEVQFIVGYRGMIDLARRSGQIVSLTARTVHQGDRFAYAYGLDERVEHVPSDGDRGQMTHVYAVAKLRDGGVQFEVLSRADVERVRNESQGWKTAVRFARDGQPPNSPWASDFDEMAKKTAIRRLFKYLPVSIELQQAVANDERADAGLSQEHTFTFDANTGEVVDGPPPADADASSLDPVLIEERIAGCSDIDVLELIADDVDSMPPSPVRDSLNRSIAERREAITNTTKKEA